MYARHYYDMLYSFDGSSIERIPINQMYWEEELKSRLTEIRELQKDPRGPLRDWNSKPADWELPPELDYRYDEPPDISDEPSRTRRRSR